MNRHFTTLITIILSAMPLAAEPALKFTRISSDNGLSHNTVNTILQDRQGFIWFGTQNGLNRYDGFAFKTFISEPGDTNSISDNFIRALIEDRQGNIWIGTSDGGLNKYNRNLGLFSRFPTRQNYSPGNQILSLCEDHNGHIWMGTKKNGLYRLEPESGTFFQYTPDFEQNVPELMIISIDLDKNGVLWLATANGLYSLDLTDNAYLDPSKAEFSHYKHDPADRFSLSNDVLQKVYVDHDNRIWVGAWEGGLNQLDRSSGRFYRYQHDPENPGTLSDNDVVDICSDNQGYLWIATDGGGLNRFHPKSGAFSHYRNKKENTSSLSHDRLRTLLICSQNILWIGTEGSGFSKLNMNTLPFEILDLSPGAQKNKFNSLTIRSILEDHDGDLWIGTNGDGLFRKQKSSSKIRQYLNNPSDDTSLPNNDITTIYEDQKKRLWIGTWGGGLCLYNRDKKAFKVFQSEQSDSQSLSDNRIQSIIEDTVGHLWVGTENGLNRMNPDTFLFKRYFKRGNDYGSLSDNRIQSLYIDRKAQLWVATWSGLNRYLPEEDAFVTRVFDDQDVEGHRKTLSIFQDEQDNFWVGTFGQGLCRFKPGSKCQTLTTQDGLPGNIIYGILQDNDGHLFMSTNRGLSRYDPEKQLFRNYKVEDGLISDEFYWGAYAMSSDGKMYFGTVKGLISFYPDSLIDPEYNFPVVLTDVRILNKPVPVSAISTNNRLNLNPRQTQLSFQFAALDYTNPLKNTYYYKMEGLTDEWQYSHNRRYVDYSNLKPGNYTLKVRALNSKGKSSTENISLHIHISPPYWQTAWFRFFIAVVLLLVLYAIYRIRIAQVNRQRLRLRQKIDERTRQLRSINHRLRTAKKETDNILYNVDEGFFLLHNDHRIGSQYSKSLEKMFEKTGVGEKILFNFLDNHLPKETISSSVEYFELMFENEIDEDTLADLNPLSAVKMEFNGEADKHDKYLTFRFKRILNKNNEVEALFATVHDVTDQTKLAKKLQEAEAEQKKQMELMFSVLHVEPSLLGEFMMSVEHEIGQIEKQLKNQISKPVLQTIYRSAHSIKGNASLLDLRFFVQSAHEFEDMLVKIESEHKYDAQSHTSLCMRLDLLSGMFKELKSLIAQIQNFQTNFRPKRRYENKLMLQSIENLAQTSSKDLGKQIQFKHEEFAPDSIPYQYRYLVKEILIQLIRNSLSHGIEHPDERESKGKPPVGKLSLSSLLTTNMFGFTFRDDGRGINIQKLKAKAIQAKIFSEEKLNEWSDSALVELMFESGLSTQDSSDLIAGRGIGMDIIRTKLNNVKGTIEVKYEPDTFTEFTIKLPLPE